MSYLDVGLPFVRNNSENVCNQRDEPEVGSNFISETWSNNLSNNSNTDLSLISENTAAGTECVNWVLTEGCSQPKVNTIPIGLPADSESVNNDQLPEHGDFISTGKMSSESPLFSKTDDTPCDSSGSYHTAACSESLENLSDCSGPFEDVEELPADYDENQGVPENGRSPVLVDAQKEQSSDRLNSSKNENSINVCSTGLQSYCCKDQERIVVNKHKTELGGLNAEGEAYELDGELNVSRFDNKSESDVNSNCKRNKRAITKIVDEKKSFEYETTSGPQEEINVCCGVVVPDDTLLTSNRNSYTQEIADKSTEYDLSVKDTDIKNCKGNGDQQVQLSIIAQNSVTGERNSLAQLTKVQKTGVNRHESPSCYLQPGLNKTEELFQVAKFENSFKNEPCVNGKRADCTSETSSVASELDETDYEVQKLTALAFRSLSCPNDDYLDIYNSRAFIDFSSPLSEASHKTNRLSTCITGLDCTGVFDSNEECSDSSNTACTLPAEAEEGTIVLSDDSLDREQCECVDVIVETQAKNKDFRTNRTVRKRQIELRKRQRSELKVFTSRGTINSSVCVDPRFETENKEETSECLHNFDNVENTDVKNEGCIDEGLHRATTTGGLLSRNKFASYLIANVISKKMQFEQGLKMEHELDKNTNSVISPAAIFVKKKDFDRPTIVSQQIDLEDSVSKSEPFNFIQGQFGKNSCELNDTSIEKNRKMGQKHSFSCSSCEGSLNRDGKKNPNILNGCGTSVFRNWSESNIDSQNETITERTFELNPEKPCPMLHGLNTNTSGQEKNMNASCILEDENADFMSHAAEETMTVNNRMESEEAPYKIKTSGVQLGNTPCKINTSNNIFVLKSPELLHSSQSANVKQTSPFCIGKELSPSLDSNLTGLDLMHQILPTSFKFESELEQEKCLQSNIKDNITVKNKTKGPPYHVRDVRKLVQSTYGPSMVCSVKAESDVPQEIHNLSSSEQPLLATQHKLSPIFIQCQSISSKTDKGDNSRVTVDKKYWACRGSSNTLRIFSSDYQIPLSFNKQKNKVISAKRIGCKSYPINENENKVNTHLTCLANIMPPERKIQALSISNNQESKLSLMKAQVGTAIQKNHSTNFVLNSEITELVPGKGKRNNEFQVGLEDINTDLSSSATSSEDTEMSLSKMEPHRDIKRELENENEFSTKSNSNNKDISMAFDKGEPRGGISDRTQNKTTLLRNSPLNRNVDYSQRKREHKQGDQTKMEIQNNQQGIFNYDGEHVELSNEKNNPQNDIQVSLKNQNGIFHNSSDGNKDLGVSSRINYPNKYFTMGLENQNECLSKSTENDEEALTPIKKNTHKKEIQLRLEKQNKMSENLTLDNEGATLSLEKHELESKLQVGLEDLDKLFENSTLNVESANLLLDDPKGHIELDQDNQNALVLKTEDSNILPDINKHKNELQIGLQDENKSLYDSGSNGKLSPIINNLNKQIHNVMEGQNNLLNHCLQNKDEKEFKIDQNTLRDTCKVEMIPTTEKFGLTFISEFQPFKDNNTISTVSEEGGQNATKGCSECRISKVVGEHLSPAQVSFPNDISLIPVKTTESSAVSPGSSNCPETINISSQESLQETETQDVHDKSAFSDDIQNATVNKLPTSQATLNFTNLNVKLQDSINPDVKLSTKTIGDQAKQQFLEVKTVAVSKASSQQEASVSDQVNYLTMPIKEHKPKASPQIQMPASLHPFGHYSTTTSSHQHNWESLDPHKQEQLTFPPTRQTPNVVEKCCKVPQSPHVIANPQFPCFQYSPVDKKMLIDPETGKHYFVEASIQFPRKMLLDPETGCYVEIIIPQQTYCAAPFSPYVLYPNTLKPTYIPRMQYSNLFSPPLIKYSDPSCEPPEVQIQSNLNDTTDKQDHKSNTQKKQLTESNYMESPYYIPTGVSVNPTPAQASLEVMSTHTQTLA
ncbi:uncharacterized protein LOC119965210 isoform X1 [Scyliorhinus canicula]|uniref:uncharacterized protein LOC119965210 isoform X1 n=1 Tax=Scyliorhinus canicula TaxID=7830 RepID=UPI0018F71FD8|nr:uncharacterized protein LOC119965210 isoform X1 [Scyliorhinus canicula]